MNLNNKIKSWIINALISDAYNFTVYCKDNNLSEVEIKLMKLDIIGWLLVGDEIIEKRIEDMIRCPICGSVNVYKNHVDKDYRCIKCGQEFYKSNKRID